MDQTATDIGTRLQRARGGRGLSLRDIANTTKISTAALDAIEHNDFARLPGGVFRRAYVRAFAEEVGLDADELAREYRARFERDEPAGSLPPPRTNWHDRLRQFTRLPAVFVTIGGILVGASVILTRGQAPDVVPDEGPPLRAVEAEEATEPTGAPGPTEEVALVGAGVVEGSPQMLRLEIRLNGPCWVSAMADGERVVYRLMQPGERALIEARSAITLRLGDAGSVAYSINGATGRPLGRNGEAVTVRITNDSVGTLYAEPPSPRPATAARTRRGSELLPGSPVHLHGPGRSVTDGSSPGLSLGSDQ